MKKLIAITGSILFICIVISYFIPASPSKAVRPDEVSLVPESSTQSSIREEESVRGGYMIKAYERRVAVFDQDSGELLYISDTYINDLPQADRQQLQKGLYAATRKEMLRLIEDYCS